MIILWNQYSGLANVDIDFYSETIDYKYFIKINLTFLEKKLLQLSIFKTTKIIYDKLVQNFN